MKGEYDSLLDACACKKKLYFFISNVSWDLYHIHTNIHEGKATRLAELALIFIPIYNVAVSDTSHSKL